MKAIKERRGCWLKFICIVLEAFEFFSSLPKGTRFLSVSSPFNLPTNIQLNSTEGFKSQW